MRRLSGFQYLFFSENVTGIIFNVACLTQNQFLDLSRCAVPVPLLVGFGSLGPSVLEPVQL